MKKLLSIILVLAMLATFCSGCSQKTNTPLTSTSESTTPAPGGAPSEPVKDSITLISKLTPNSLDPMATSMAFAMIVMVNIYDNLMKFDADGNLECSLAESYEGNDACTEYTFKLKQGVKFHNGEELTADDIVFCWKRGVEMNVSGYSMIADCTAISDYEVKYMLTQSYSPFPGLLAGPFFHVLNEEAVMAAGEDYGRNPVGTGAYKFVEWSEGEHIKLESFEDYFKGVAPIKYATYKFIADENTALINLEGGEADYSHVLPAISRDDVEASDDLTLIRYNANALQMFALNCKNEYLSNKLVRQAINFAIDRESMVLIAGEGEGSATSQFANVGAFGYFPDYSGYTFDVEKAKQLMKDAGYPDGFSIKITAQDDMTNKMASVMASNLAEIGITCEIETIEANTAVANLFSGDYEIGVLGLGNLQNDLDFIKAIFSGALNMSQNDNVAISAVFDKAAAVSSDEGRLRIYRDELYPLLWDESIYVPVYFPLRAHACNSDLNVAYVPSSGFVELYNMSWK